MEKTKEIDKIYNENPNLFNFDEENIPDEMKLVWNLEKELKNEIFELNNELKMIYDEHK